MPGCKAHQKVRDAMNRVNLPTLTDLEASSLLKVAGHAARLGGWIVHLESKEVVWSDETAAIHDLPPGTTPNLSEAINYYAPEYRNAIEGAFAMCALEGKPYDEIMQILTSKGRRVWVRAIGQAVRNQQGAITDVHGAFQDVSELVEARNESRRLSERLRATLDNISEAFATVDNDWCFTFVNRAGSRLLKRREADLLGKNLWIELPEIVGSEFERQYRLAMKTQSPVTFVEHSPLRNKWFLIKAYPSEEGLAIYLQDVTKDKAQQDQLRLLESAISRLNDIVIITKAEPIDGSGPEIVFVNDAFVSLTGHRREDAIGKTPRILQGPKTERKERDRIHTALAAWKSVRAELTNYTKSGLEIPMELDIAPIANESGWYTHRRTAQTATRHASNDYTITIVGKTGGETVDQYEAFANSIYFSTTSETEGERHIDYSVTDDGGLTSNIGAANVSVSNSYEVSTSEFGNGSASLGSDEDPVNVKSSGFARLWIGDGQDTIHLARQDADTLDITGYGANKVSLSIDDVLNMTDGDNHLTVLGDKGDMVTLTSTGGNHWTAVESKGEFTTYAYSDPALHAVIEISNQLNTQVA